MRDYHHKDWEDTLTALPVLPASASYPRHFPKLSREVQAYDSISRSVVCVLPIDHKVSPLSPKLNDHHPSLHTIEWAPTFNCFGVCSVKISFTMSSNTTCV